MSARVLVVDDEESIREIIVAMLSPAGYECKEATDGVEALAILDSGEKFDLVLSDIMMSPLDGIGLLEELKKRYPRLPVAIECPIVDKEIVKRAYDSGAKAYLYAPFEREDLIATVRRVLEESRSEQNTPKSDTTART